MSATTPRRANVSAHHTPSNSPSRRVLGDLTPKAINTPSKQTNNLESTGIIRAQSPLKQVHTLPAMAVMGKENAVGGVVQVQGKKRSIHEVDGAENVEHASKPFLGRDISLLETESPAMGETSDTLVINIDRGSSTEPDTPPPAAAEPMEDVIDNSQASNQSFSAFVNWKECDSMGQLTAMVKEVEEEKKTTRAEKLKARLGLGMYKVKTNQIEKSGSEIMTTWETTSSSDSLNASTSTHSTKTSSAPSAQPIPSITLSHIRQPAVSHVVANLDPGRPIPKLIGGPQLLPTAFSSRMIHEYALPSSPPDDLPKCVSPEMVMSPTRPDYRTPVMKRIIEEEYSDDEEEEDELSPEERQHRQREKRFKMGDLTSSVVKGNAAKGLLELMSGRR